MGNTGKGALKVSNMVRVGADSAHFTVNPISFTVNAGAAAQTVTVTFAPSSVGPKTASLSVAHNAAGSPSAISLSGVGVTTPLPDIDVLPIALNFGDVEAGQSKPLTLVIANRGKALLTVSGISSSNEVFKASSTTLAIAPGDSQRVTVTFTPTAAGAQSGALTITSDDPDEQSVKVVLNGNGTAPVFPKIEVFPTVINFGAVTIGQTKTATIEVTNKGGGTLRVANIVFSSQDFSVDATSFSLKAGEKKSLTITFAPSKATNVNETLDIPSDDPDNKFLQVPLRATVRQSTAGPALSVQVNTLDFGQVDFGRGMDLNLPIKNEGTGPLNVSNITSDNVQVTVSPTSLIVQAGQARTVTVTYRPQALRERAGNIRLTSDDSVQPAVRVPWTASEAVTGKALTVVESSPSGGAVAVPLKTELTVTFSEPIFARKSFIAVDASLLPEPASGDILGQARVEGRKVIFPVELKNNTFYRFVLFGATATSGAELDKTYSISFTTDLSRPVVGTLAGTVSLSGGTASKTTVLLFDQKSVQVAQVAAESDGRYQFSNLAAGQYFVYAQADLSDGGRASGGATRNPVSLSAGQTATGIDISMKAVDRPAPGTNPTAGASFDLDPATGNQRSTSLGGVKAGQPFALAVYADGVRDLIGYGVSVEYDTTKVTFVGADVESGEEKNLLKTQGGTMLFLKTPPQGNVLTVGGALLSPTSATAPDGGGLLGVLRFVALDGFSSSADFRIPRILFRGLSGRDTVEVNVSASISTQGGTPAGFDTVEVAGPVAIDLNTAEGDQGIKTKKGVKAGSTVSLQLFVKNAPAISGFSVRLEFDATMLKVGTFTASDFVPDKLSLSPVQPSPGIVDVGVGNLTGKTGAGDGLFGTATFQVTEKFSKETRIAATLVVFSQPSGKRQEIKQRVLATLLEGGKEVGPDFTGDGIVDFNDFFVFAAAFGTRNSECDLTGDGIVDFNDFFVFATVFGQKAGKPSAVSHQRSAKVSLESIGYPSIRGLQPLLGETDQPSIPSSPGGAYRGIENSDVRYRLESQPLTSDRMTLQVALEGHQSLKGYAFTLRYDPEAWAFEDADASVPLFAARPDGTGDLQIAGAVVEGVLGMDRPVAELRFRRLREGGSAITITEAMGLSAEGEKVALTQRDVAASLAGRSAYGLNQNYPNPFNPATRITYQLPGEAHVRLVVYNLLGQRVRVLVDGLRPAGVHTIEWNGLDEASRKVGSGIYFCRLQTEGFTQVRKMVLTR